ncbi:Cas7 group CRISPR-associated protein Csh2 [Lactobacillus colini]|uniref:Cas7 group CRISPR-associated protein Csh2 n=1 Tax=Lactobacillus colini TaxID=1819254 RepID=A0ABS4MH14_9LACO|nr:Cas7 group CRISPR-associated protein Csh2 [Lactobacillus colini]
MFNLQKKTGFSEEDAEAIHEALKTLFENDESSARPAGSMQVVRVYWWDHNNKLGQYSPAKVSKMVEVKNKNDMPTKLEDFEFIDKTPEDLKEDVFEG